MNNLTAAEEVLLAADKLTKSSKNEFTEWQLTVETWKLNRTRWGLRGFEQTYPDHKRVMNEIMAKGTQKVVGKGWLERTRPNHYRLTSSGLAKSSSMKNIEVTSKTRMFHEYDAVAPYISHKVFENYCKNSDEPKTWLGVSAFLGLANNDPETLEKQLNRVNESIELGLEGIAKSNDGRLRMSDSSKSIDRSQLMRLKEFIAMLEIRFKAQFDAIRRRAK